MQLHLTISLPDILAGRDSWYKNKTIQQAINIDDGVIIKTSILSFQQREQEYPHKYLNTAKISA